MMRRVFGLSAIVFAAAFLGPGMDGTAFAAHPGAQTTPRAIVPNLVGRTEQEARRLLEAAGLAVGQVMRIESDAKPGTVVRQDHDPHSQVPPNTPIGFAVATPRMVRVPKVVGRQQSDAAATLAKSGLRVGEVRRQPSRESRGKVLEQGTASGLTVPEGSAVDLVVAAPLTAAVPPIVGRTQADALDMLKRAGLVPGEITLQESRSPKGLVLSQRPPAGQVVPAGTGVDMVVATPVMVSVPRLVGRSQEDAAGLLEKAELVSSAVTSEESRRPEGTVLSQEPKAGDKVAIGTAVSLVVARPVTVLVPSVVGRTQAQATDVLANAELVTGDVTSEQSRRPEGTVLSQDPVAGRRVVIGTQVGLVLARPVTVQVPSLVDRTRSNAAGLLKKVELVLGEVRTQEARRPPGTVLSQRPPAGTIVTIGSAVSIVTATPVTTLVPNVVSRSEAEARQAFAKAELATGTVTPEESRSPAGSVLRQSPVAGTRVVIGTPINLTTAVPVTVLVPSLVGGTERDARARLAAIELTPGTIGYRESPHPGTVLAQGVAQGTRVPIGTVVSFVVGVIETVPVPSVVGLPVEKARDALTDGRLLVGAEEARATHLQPEGTVLAQSVRAGTRTAVGSPVGLTVAAIEMVAVPPVVGLSHDEATAAIAAAGLTLGAVTARVSLRAGGTVLVQTLQPSQQVPWGTAVALDEARPRVVWMAPAGGFVLLLAGVAGLVTVRKRRRGSKEPEVEPGPLPLAADVEVWTHVDAGDTEVRADETPAIRQEMRIQPVLDRGSQEVSATGGGLVRDERRGRAAGTRPPEEKPS